MTDTFTIAMEGTEKGQHLFKLAKELREQWKHAVLDPRLVAEMVSIIDGQSAPQLPELPKLCRIESVDADL